MGDIAAQKPNGLKTALDTIIAPKAAFEAIRTAPAWAWAFLISILISMICSYLLTPAAVHALAADWPNQIAKSPQLAGMSADQQQRALMLGEKFASYFFLLFLLLIPLGNVISATVMTIFNALGRGDGTFGKYWAASCNIGVVSWGLYSIVLAVIVLARGADSFTTSTSVTQAIPSLAMVAPGANVKLATALYYFNPLTLWGIGLVIAAMLIVGRVPKVQAWLAGITMFVLPLLLGVAGAK